MRVHHQKSLGHPISRQTEVAAETSEAVLSHRSCLWGGRLIKMEVPMLGCGAFRQSFGSPRVVFEGYVLVVEAVQRGSLTTVENPLVDSLEAMRGRGESHGILCTAHGV